MLVWLCEVLFDVVRLPKNEIELVEQNLIKTTGYVRKLKKKASEKAKQVTIQKK